MMRRFFYSVSAAALLAGGQSAFAADMPVKAAPAPAAVIAPQWYVSVFGGWSKADDWGFAFRNINTGATFPYLVSLDNGFVVGGAVGREINPNVRFEIEVAYQRFRFGDDYRSVPAGFQGLNESGDLSVITVTGNVWVSFWQGPIIPYLGGGLGWGFANGDLTISNGAGAQIDGHDNGFAFMAGGGFRVPFGGRFELDVGYRFRNVVGITIPSAINGFDTVSGKDVRSHSVQGGLTMKF